MLSKLLSYLSFSLQESLEVWMIKELRPCSSRWCAQTHLAKWAGMLASEPEVGVLAHDILRVVEDPVRNHVLMGLLHTAECFLEAQ